MKTLIDRIRNEPALVSGFVVALLTLLAAFGLDLTAEQTGSISAVVVAGLAFVVRSQVTPTRKTDEAGSLPVGDAVVLVFLGIILLAVLGYIGR